MMGGWSPLPEEEVSAVASGLVSAMDQRLHKYGYVNAGFDLFSQWRAHGFYGLEGYDRVREVLGRAFDDPDRDLSYDKVVRVLRAEAEMSGFQATEAERRDVRDAFAEVARGLS